MRKWHRKRPQFLNPRESQPLYARRARHWPCNGCSGEDPAQQPARNRLDSSFISWSAAEEAQHVLLLGQPNATFNGAAIGWRRVPTTHPRGAASPAAFRKETPRSTILPSSVAKTSQRGSCQAVFMSFVRLCFVVYGASRQAAARGGGVA